MIRNINFADAWNKGYQEYRDFARQEYSIFLLAKMNN